MTISPISKLPVFSLKARWSIDHFLSNDEQADKNNIKNKTNKYLLVLYIKEITYTCF